MANCDWARLVSQGRAKDIGVSWSNDEMKAIYDEKVPVEYVRRGVLSHEEYLRVKFEGKPPLDYMTDEELKAEALKLGVVIDPVMSRFDVIRHLKEEKDKPEPVVKEKEVEAPMLVEPESPPEDFVAGLDKGATKDALKEAGVEFDGRAKLADLKALLVEKLK